MSSLVVLLQLLPAVESAAISIVAGARAESAHPDALGRDVLTRLATDADILDLGPFPREEMPALLAHVLQRWGRGNGRPSEGHEWATRAAERIHARSGGVPLLVEDLLAALDVGRGRRPGPAEIDAAADARTVHGAAARVIADLPDEVGEVLSVIAGLGSAAEMGLIASAVGDEERVTSAVEVAEGAGLITASDQSIAFTHPSYREAAAARRLTSDRHLAIARASARRGRSGDRQLELFHLVRAGTQVPAAEVFATARAAAAEAAAVGDPAGQARALQAAIAHHPDPAGADGDDQPDVVALHLDAARAWHLAGVRTAAWAEARAAAARKPPAEQLAEAALLLAEGQEFAEDFTEALDLLALAQTAAGDRAPLRAALLAAEAHLRMYKPFPGAPTGAPPHGPRPTPVDVARVRSLASQAYELAAGEPELVARAARVWRETHSHPGFHEARRRASEEAAAATSDEVLAGKALVLAGLDALEAGDRDAADSRWSRARELAHRTGDLGLRWRVALVEAMSLRAQGRLADADNAREAARTAGTRAGEPGRDFSAMIQAALLDLDRDLAGSALARTMSAEDDVPLRSLTAGSAYGLALQGQFREAAGLLEQLVPALVSHPDQEPALLPTITLAADAVATVARADLAPPLLRVMAPFRSLIAVDLLDGLATVGCVARPLGRLLALTGDRDAAEEAFAEAERRDEAAGLDLYALQGRIDRAEAHAAAGEPVDSEHAADLARAAQRMGATVLTRRAHGLERPGGTPRLTDRQHDILHQLAAGRSYQQIADALGFAHTTIRKDVLRVYRALGVRTRDEAIAAARNLDLLR